MLTGQATANGEKQLGHWMLTNMMLLWVVLLALLGGAAGYGLAQGSNAGDHKEFLRRLDTCETREARLEDDQRNILRSLTRIETLLSKAQR